MVYCTWVCCFALFVCLTLLASFFPPSHLSFQNMCMYITKYGCVFLKLGESIYVAMDLIPILLGSLPLAHNAQHSLVMVRGPDTVRGTPLLGNSSLLLVNAEHYGRTGPSNGCRIM